METITNVEVSKVFKGKSGEGQYGPWQIWDVYFNGDNRKFTYFEKGNVIPEVGMMVLVLKFDVEKKGQYTNYTVKELTPDPEWWSGKEPETPHRTPPVGAHKTFSPKRELCPMSFLGGFVKDITVQSMQSNEMYHSMPVEDVVEIYGQCCLNLYNKLNKNIQEPEKASEPVIRENEDFPDDEPPLPEPPPY